MGRKILFILLIMLLCLLVWKSIMPVYNYQYYKFDNCPNTCFTVIKYHTISDRGIFFVNGKVNSIPSSGYLQISSFYGSDAVFDCIAECVNDTIVLTYYEGFFDYESSPSRIITKNVDNSTYDKLKMKEGVVDIRLW